MGMFTEGPHQHEWLRWNEPHERPVFYVKKGSDGLYKVNRRVQERVCETCGMVEQRMIRP